MQGIYEIVNTANGKKYIGSSVHIKKRWYEHRYSLRKGEHGNSHLQAAWDRYGSKSFVFRVIEEVDNPEALIQREQWWHDEACTDGNETYNAGKQVDCPTRGTKFDDERLAQMSIISRQLWEDPDFRAKTTAAHMGHTASEKTRRKMGAAHKGQKPTTDAIETSRRAIKRKWREDIEYREKMQKHMSDLWEKPEFRAKMDQLNRTGKSYPAFVQSETGEIIPAGTNLKEMCRKRGLGYSGMYLVSKGKRRANHGWILLVEE